MAFAVAHRSLRLCKMKGITVVCTSLMEGNHPEAEATPIQISTIADTWIHLSHMPQGGERNRALTIVKSRGTHHSNQVRELLLSDEGVTLANVYAVGGEVLMGTLRWEKEQVEEIEQERISVEVELKRRELERAEAEVRVRAEALNREIETRRAELKRLLVEEKSRQKRATLRRERLRQMRGADADASTTRESEGA